MALTALGMFLLSRPGMTLPVFNLAVQNAVDTQSSTAD